MLTSPVLAHPRIGGRLQALVAALADRPIFWVAFVVTLFAFPILRSIRAERDLPRNRPVLGQIRDFALRDQNGNEVGGSELRERVWVASFTALRQEPPSVKSQRLLGMMNEARHRTRNLGDAVRLLTFIVEPDLLDPRRMTLPGPGQTLDAEHADSEAFALERAVELTSTYRASHGTWRFVTGPNARLRRVLDDFRVEKALPEARVALVDGNLQIRGYYELADEAALGALLRDIGLLVSVGQ